jgi:hypothetical protein
MLRCNGHGDSSLCHSAVTRLTREARHGPAHGAINGGQDQQGGFSMKRLFLGCAVAAIATSAAYAQETTSSIRGTVTSAGMAVPGAEVIITHVPSGTRSSVTTDASGSFNASGLRVGGPFTVAVSAAGFSGAQITDIQTVVAQPYDLPIELAGEGQEIVVNASRLPGARTVSQGPATVLTARDIANVATVNRDIRDLSRRDPFARLEDTPSGGRAISFAGQNARYNRFSVDGVPITDNFGLNTDGLPSRRSPIPLDAIGQFQAKVAPFDVREGNFQGGAINIVLRSGTNDFQGTGFFAYSSDELTGKKTRPGPGVPTGKVTLPNFEIKNYGVELSGPIIKDKLFFMIAGERIRASTPIAEGPSDNNAGTAISTLTNQQVQDISAIAQSRYGYDTGGVLSDSGDKDDRLVAKIDANLSETQRLSLTYTYAKDQINLGQNTFTTAPQGLGLASNGYIQGNRLHTGVAQLNSDWSDEFSTEARVFYKNYKRIQDPILGRGFAQFQVCAAPTSDRATAGAAATASINCPTNFSSVSFGPDISRQTNALSSETWGGLVQARLTRGDHDLRVFTDIQDTKVFNAFLQRSSGDYYFDSIADFAAGNAQRFRYGNAFSLDPNDAAAKFRYQAYTWGIMDTWRLGDTLNVTYGARYDLYGGHSRAALNSNFVDRYGFANTAYLSGRGIFQPRFGFDFKPVQRLSVRGGVGIFSGGTPDVYVSNSFSNTGVLTNSIEVQQLNTGLYSGSGLSAAQAAATGGAILTNVNGATIPAAANSYLAGGSVAALSTTNALDPDFKIPSQWRATLSATYAADFGGPIGDGWEFGGDLFYSAVRNQVYFTDLRVRPTNLTTPDGRVRYAPVTSFADTNSDIYLTNSKRGRSYIAIARARKTFDFGVDMGVSFTYQDIKDQNPATSSTAGSNYAAGVSLDANGPAYGISNDQVKYQIKSDFTFDHAFFGDYKTTFALFTESRVGRPYSFTFRDTATRSTVFGTIGTGTRYLMYVPTGVNDPLVSYDTAANAAAINAYIDKVGLGKYRGKIAPRNAFNSKWFTRMDLHLAQEVPTGLGSSRVTLFADVENFTNLISKKWGQIREYAFPYTVSPVTVTCLTRAVPTGTATTGATTSNSGTTPGACTQYRYVPNSTGAGGSFVEPSDTIYSRQSLYAIRVGAKFSF